jgi:hypothetical protein
MFRKDGGVHVQTAIAGQVKNRLGQDLSVGSDNDKLGLKIPELLHKSFIGARRAGGGRFFSRAIVLTGPDRSFKSRPLGLSGWVTAASILKSGRRQRAVRLGHASSAVPMKMIFSPDIVLSFRHPPPHRAATSQLPLQKSIGPGNPAGDDHGFNVAMMSRMVRSTVSWGCVASIVCTSSLP